MLMTQCPIEEEPWHATVNVLGIMGNRNGVRSHRERLRETINKYYGDRVHKESKSSIKVGSPMTARQRLQSRLPRNESRTTERDQPDCRSHFAREQPRSQCLSKSLMSHVPVVHRDLTQQTSTSEDTVFFLDHDAAGILDLGASKTVIGSQHLPSLIAQLDPALKKQLRRCPCHITFRFGNQGTLTSSQALVIPLGSLLLKVAIVKGGTPFLLCNTLMRALHASIDCQSQVLRSPKLGTPVNLKLSP